MSGTDGYPERNPFPYLGTFTIAGERRDLASRSERWVLREPIRRLIDEVNFYRRDFQPEWSGLGRAVMVRGPHGSGKTHAVYAALKQAGEDMFAIYTLQQDEDFFDCYRQTAARVNKEPGLWKKLARTLLATMAAEQWSEELKDGRAKDDPPGDGESAQRLAGPLRLDPSKAEGLFESYTVGRGAAAARQDRALLDLTQAVSNKDLKNAVDALQGGKFDDAAARWLALDPVSADELAAMGISGPIAQENAGAVILLLAALLSNANYKLVFVIDQVEKLLVKTESLIARRNEGYLRTLIEGFPIRNAFLLLAGSDDGWNCLPEDIQARLRPRVFDCPLLALEEACDFLRLYLTPLDAPFTAGQGSLYPFKEDAVREMLTLSAGNPRRLLQFCHEAFQQAAPSRGVIDSALIRQAAGADSRIFDRTNVLADTRRVLASQTLRFEEQARVGGMLFDFVLRYPGGAPALLIEVTAAIFQDDEAASAYATAGRVANLRDSGVQVPLVLVATGYVSPDIVGHLSKVVHKLIVYAPDRYESELRRVVEDVARHAGPEPLKAPANRELEEKVERLLKQLSEERSGQAAVVETRATELAETQARTRYQERLERARNDWPPLRRELEEKIQAARKARREKALKEVNDQIRRSRYWWWGRDAAMLAAAVALAAAAAAYHADRTRDALPAAAITFVGMAGFDSLLAFLLGAWSTLASARDLTSVHASSLARTYGRIHWGNPIVRLAAYLGQEGLIPSEHLALIRETALRNVDWSTPWPREIWNIPEILLALEDGAKVSVEGKPASELQSVVDILRAFRGGEHRPFVTQLAFEIGARKGPWFDAFNVGLEAFEPGRDASPTDTLLPFVSERDLREAVHRLSPLEEGGLGTYDFLKSIATIDEMFLFCSQLLFYTDRDVLRKSGGAESRPT